MSALRNIMTAALIAALPATTMPLRAQTPRQDQAAEQTGNAFYCQERRLGYWFYCVRPKPVCSSA